MQTLSVTPHQMPPLPPQKTAVRSGLFYVAIFKLVKGTLLLSLALGLLSLLDRDIEAMANQLVNALRIDPTNRHVVAFLAKAGVIEDHQITQISILTGLYSLLLLTEGLGLLYRKVWAEYLTVAATSLLIPIELYEVICRTTPIRISILTLNIIVVAYLIRVLKRQRAVHSIHHSPPV